MASDRRKMNFYFGLSGRGNALKRRSQQNVQLFNRVVQRSEQQSRIVAELMPMYWRIRNGGRCISTPGSTLFRIDTFVSVAGAFSARRLDPVALYKSVQKVRGRSNFYRSEA